MTANNPFEKRAILTLAIIVLIGIVLCDFLVANMYKFVQGDSFYQLMTNPGEGSERQYRIFSELYHHDLRKNIRAIAVSGPLRYPMVTNSLGFRDRENREISKQSDRYRVLFMGDSFVEGTGVAYEESLVGILAQLYGERYELLNAGVISYAPTAYYRKSRYLIEQVGLHFDEMVVFIDISDISDEVDWYRAYDENLNLSAPQPAVVPQAPRSQQIKQFFRNNSVLYAIPRLIKNRKLASEQASADPDINPTIRHRRALWTVEPAQYEKYAVLGLAKAKKNILNLKELLDRHGIKLDLVVYPWPTQIYYKDLDSLQVKEWKSFCETNGIEFVSLFADFIDQDPEKNKKTILEYFVKNDMHWNEKGNRKAADALRAKLEIFH